LRADPPANWDGIYVKTSKITPDAI
jgi:hypothetical protein